MLSKGMQYEIRIEFERRLNQYWKNYPGNAGRLISSLMSWYKESGYSYTLTESFCLEIHKQAQSLGISERSFLDDIFFENPEPRVWMRRFTEQERQV